MKNKIFNFLVLIAFPLVVAGCSTTRGNVGQMSAFAVPSQEAQWIRDGHPIEFEDELWYPQDGIEILVDTEVDRMGEYKGVDFFIDKADVRPYNRLYTKFDRNKFRFFERKSNDD